jgi:hypothetical protein
MAAALLAVLLAPGLLVAADVFGDEVVAKGKGIEVRRADLDQALSEFRSAAVAQGRSIPDTELAAIEAKMLERLLLTRLVKLRATEEDKAKARGSAERVLRDTRRRAISEDSLRRQLLVMGMTPEGFEERIRDQALAEVVLERELKAKIEVTEKETEQYYEKGIDAQVRELQARLERLPKDQAKGREGDGLREEIKRATQANLARLDRPETIRVNHLLFHRIDPDTRKELPPEAQQAKRELAGKTLARLKAGEDPVKLAREVSEEPDANTTGGEYTIPRQGAMVPELKAALDALEKGKWSEVVESPTAYHVLRILAVNPAGKTPLAEARKDLVEYLRNQEMIKRLPDYQASLMKEYEVKLTRQP